MTWARPRSILEAGLEEWLVRAASAYRHWRTTSLQKRSAPEKIAGQFDATGKMGTPS
jgi:hypothetical protein